MFIQKVDCSLCSASVPIGAQRMTEVINEDAAGTAHLIPKQEDELLELLNYCRRLTRFRLLLRRNFSPQSPTYTGTESEQAVSADVDRGGRYFSPASTDAYHL